MSGVQVYCRFRPQNSHELKNNGSICVKSNKISTAVDLSFTEKASEEGSAMFTFDRVFVPSDTQDDIFETTTRPLIRDSLNGFNCTIIAYGQTGSGKTHTMEGPPGCQFTNTNNEMPDDAGVLPRIAEALFKEVPPTEEEEQVPTTKTISMSVIEIYLERIVDLLDNTPNTYAKKQNSDLLKIREDASGGVYLEGVTENQISSPAELLACLESAGKKRATGGHAMNARSSRSHLVAVLTLTSVKEGVTTVGKLSVCDLAGSEMVRKTEAAGQRLQEAKAINRSLSALGNVINALTLPSTQQAHIPYRDSKLTRLLQDSLGGNAKTALIVTASVSSFNCAETLSTLRFGTRAKRLRNKPRVNAERTVGEYKKLLKESDTKIKDLLTMVQELQAEVQSLKMRLDKAGSHCGPPAGAARNVIKNLKHQQPVEEESDDEEGLTWIPGNDEDLKLAAMESEEMETLRRKVDQLGKVVEVYEKEKEIREREIRAEGDEKLAKYREDEEKVRTLMKADMLSQYTRGWQVGQRAAGAAYSDQLEEDMKERDAVKQKEEEELAARENAEREMGGGDSAPDDSSPSLTIEVNEQQEQEQDEQQEQEEESYCQVCGLSETETASHENVDESHPHKLGPLFTCDGNCNTFVHVSCAGLSCPPTGEWYCSECSDVPIDDPLPSPMRVDQHSSFDEAAAASLAELSAVRGRFVSLRKQRDRLLARWKGERETQRRVEQTKRKLRRKREEEIVRLREVVLVLQEEVDLTDEDRRWLKEVMDSTVAFSPKRLARHQEQRVKEGRASSPTKDGANEEEPVGISLTLDIPNPFPTLTLHEQNVQLQLDAEQQQAYLAKANDIWENASKTMKSQVEATSMELGSVQKQFSSAKKQIMSQQRQIAKMQKIIQDQQKKVSGLEEAVGERVVGDKVGELMEGSPFGPMAGGAFPAGGNSSAPGSPTPANGGAAGGEAFGKMKSWWAGSDDEAEGGEEKKGARIEGVVKEKAESMTAPFRNRLIGLLSSIEKEAKDYNNLKERITDENKERRGIMRKGRGGRPPRESREVGERGEEEALFSKTLPSGGSALLVKSESDPDLAKTFEAHVKS